MKSYFENLYLRSVMFLASVVCNCYYKSFYLQQTAIGSTITRMLYHILCSGHMHGKELCVCIHRKMEVPESSIPMLVCKSESKRWSD